MGQSSNDTFPAAMHVAAALTVARDLIPALQRLRDELSAKASQWDKIVKIGRTHLMDATPIRVGQVFSGYAAQAEYSVIRASRALKRLQENMPIGGTAVGTGINTHPQFAAKVCVALSNELGATFTEAMNHPEAQAAKDSFVEAHGALKTIAVSLSKIANDIRHLGSGPRCSIFVAGHAARLVDHARQGKPGDLRIGDSSGLPRDRQRRGGDRGRLRRHRLDLRAQRRHASDDRRVS
jgi:fumarate hydratase class II